MTLGLTLSEAKSCVTRKARNVIYYRKTPTGWRSGVTERTVRRWRGRVEGRKGGSCVQSGSRETRDARAKRSSKTREAALVQKFADASDQRRRTKWKEVGKELRGKRDSPKRPMGLCKRDIKISLQIASTTFPFRLQSAYRIETRETDCLRSSSWFSLSSLCLSSTYFWLDLVGSERDFSATVAFLRLWIDSIFNCREYCTCPYWSLRFFRGLTSRCSSTDVTR